MKKLQSELHTQFHGYQALNIGSCGLHPLHNAFKSCFASWEIEEVVHALHYLFHKAPTRGEDYRHVTKSSIFPLLFCGHRWLENLPVAECAIEIWSNICEFVNRVPVKGVPKPSNASYDVVSKAVNDPLIIAELHFFVILSKIFAPFLKEYQTNVPLKVNCTR